MNKTLAITAIVLVAVIMGMSAVAPMIPPAFAHNAPEKAHIICENDDFLDNAPEEVVERICGAHSV